jgi:hypothetical protein
MTSPRLSKLERLAALVAIEAPGRLTAPTARTRASLIAEIRTELALRGFDWGQAHAEARRPPARPPA